MSVLASFWLVVVVALAAYYPVRLVVAGIKALERLLERRIIERDTRHGI
jgi:hypothetical protein